MSEFEQIKSGYVDYIQAAMGRSGPRPHGGHAFTIDVSEMMMPGLVAALAECGIRWVQISPSKEPSPHPRFEVVAGSLDPAAPISARQREEGEE